MQSAADKCTVCGSTDSKLIDGFYYCTECGTQNTNVQETVLEERALADGTFAQTTKRKIVTLQKEGIEMSGEWYRWHAFNFIIAGLADDLIKLGAKPTFKTRLLWIWTRYIKKYQNKSELMMNKTSQDENEQTQLCSFMVQDNYNPEEEDEGEDSPEDENSKKRNSADSSKRDIKFLSKGLIIAMLYVALNLDECDIQLSHLYRFLQEKHFDICNLNRFIPEDINVKKIPRWTSFLRSKLCTQHQIRALALSLLRNLQLGTPKVPDLRKIVDNILTELCLPSDIKPFIYSLMHYRKCNFLDIDKNTLNIDNKSKRFLIRLPDYEGTVMSYVLVAIKIYFGLDCNYEIKLSEVVDKINEENDLQKSYKIGKYSEPSDRLFSFREWCSYLQFRKIMLSKHNLRIAEKNCLDVDDYVYLEHMEERPKNNKELPDEISMDIISRLPEERNLGIIPKDLFHPTLTPLSEYTDILIDNCQDQEIKLKLAEDFKRYSLKYACENLDFLDTNMENIVIGVSGDKKSESKVILGTIITKKANTKMVYVKNCENRNWLKTNPPTIEHVICENETNDKESDHGYESEITSQGRDVENVVNKSLSDISIVDENSQAEHGQRPSNEYNNSEKTLVQTDFDNHTADTVNAIATTTKAINSTSIKENHEHENINRDNCLDAKVLYDIDKHFNDQGILEEVARGHKQVREEDRQEIIQESHLKSGREQDVQSVTDENFSGHSVTEVNYNKKSFEEECRHKLIDVDTDSLDMLNKKEIDTFGNKSLNHQEINVNTSEHDQQNDKAEIIQEEVMDRNIFDDCFDDITFKEECEQNNIDNRELNEDGNVESNQIQTNVFPDEDFDRRSDISDVLLPTFNPATFDRDKTIKELILHACKQYKIAIPAEYRTKEPRKRKETVFDPTRKVKRAKYEGKANAKTLLSDYYNHLQSDFVSRVQQEMSLAVRNSELEDNNLQQNMQISVVERNSMLDNTVAHSEIGSTTGPINEDLNITNKTETNGQFEEIDINLENTLFEDEEMQLDDLIPKCDPNFDEKLYDTDQLYLKVKEDDEDDMSFDLKDDLEIDKILSKKIDECKHTTEYAELAAKPNEDNVAVKDEYDSEDETPLSVIKEEMLLIEEMEHQEDKYERLIKKQDIPQYKYWIRHYDRNFMLRSTDWHSKFDEELKQNTPASFYFVLQECSSILNCSNFYLYKNMQNLEEYLVTKAKSCKSNVQDTTSHAFDFFEEIEEYG